jgi:hypothetical protein
MESATINESEKENYFFIVGNEFLLSELYFYIHYWYIHFNHNSIFLLFFALKKGNGFSRNCFLKIYVLTNYFYQFNIVTKPLIYNNKGSSFFSHIRFKHLTDLELDELEQQLKIKK